MKETIQYFGPDESLCGIATHPAESEGVRSRAGVILMNAGIIHKVGPNRLNVKIARRLAARGVPVLRIDYPGLGDSSLRPDDTSLAQRRVQETQQAVECLQELFGVEEFVLVGLCSGGSDSFAMAGVDSRVKGVAVLEGFHLPTMRYYWSRIIDRKKWAKVFSGRSHTLNRYIVSLRARFKRQSGNVKQSPNQHRSLMAREGSVQVTSRKEVARSLSALLQRQVQMLFVYREGHEARYSYRLREEGKRIMAQGLPHNLQVEFIREADHTFTLLASQARLIEAVEEWALPLCRAEKEPSVRRVVL